MGVRVASSSKSGKCRGTLTAVLASALLEWLLIFMLIIYALFGYLITKFAIYCELPIPCLLCSRIDNILGEEKAGFYWDMICRNHKLELSSLVYCHFHEKLVDVRGMCETCLFSFATKDKSNAETYRLLVGKLGEEDLSGIDDETYDHMTETLKHCCCCNELWNPKRQTLLQAKSTGFDVSQFDFPLNRETSQDLDISEKDNMKTTQASSTVVHVREMTEDLLNHDFGYTDLKITSDTESDIQDNSEKEAKKILPSSTVVPGIERSQSSEDPLIQFGYTDLKITSDTESDIHGSLEEAKKTQASSTIIHVREKSEDHFGYTDPKITSDTESNIQASDIRDSLENEIKETQLSSTIIHVSKKTEDPLINIGFTELKFTSDNKSDIHDSLEEATKTRASSTIIHVREKTEDHFGYTDLKTISDTESDLQASGIQDSLENGTEKTQASSTIIHVREKMEDHFGYTDLKTTSDTESDLKASDIQDSLGNETKKTQASSAIIHVREKTEDHFGYTDLKTISDTESDLQASDIQDSLENGTEKTQASSTIIHVREKAEDHFGYTDLKTTSDTESDLQASDIQECLENETEKVQTSSTILHVREKTEDHFGYTDLNITSDDESDSQISDIEDARPLISDDPHRDLILESTQAEPFIYKSDNDFSNKKPIDLDGLSPKYSPISRDLAAFDIHQAHDSPSVTSTPDIGHGLEELNWQDIFHKSTVSALTELINVSDDISDPPVSVEKIGDELLSDTQDGGSLSPDFSKDANGATVKTVAHETDYIRELGSLQLATNLNSSETKPEHNDADLQTAGYLELSDAYKLAVSSRARHLSEKHSTNMDLKLLLSQFSRGFNLPSTGILSPRLSRNFDELKTSDSSASLTMKLLQKRASLERNNSRNSIDRNESGVESLDFSAVSEIEGESEHDRLKRQLERDRKFLGSLLKELEEERNASASAANEAMAMITRLQEEKAALQMEASQELRMMEEQAEYDIDALDKLNELLAEKEKEIQNLEEELDYYRCKYPDESFTDDLGVPLSVASRDEKEKTATNVPWLITQDEREYLSESLRNLEKQLSLFCGDVRSEETNVDHLGLAGPEIKSERDENGVISEKGSFVKEENVSIVNEVSRLNERLQVLEADCSFIEHTINALADGQEELIQEIASHLRELHKVGIRRYQT